MSLSRQTTVEDSSKTAVPVRWTSPEALQTQRYDGRSDVWSLGVVAWEMTAGGALPYGEYQRTAKACVRPIIAGEIALQVHDAWGRTAGTSAAERQLAGRVRRLIQRCLTRDGPSLLQDGERRPDSEQLVAEVDSEWEQWRAEAGEAAVAVERDWLVYHEELHRHRQRAQLMQNE